MTGISCLFLICLFLGWLDTEEVRNVHIFGNIGIMHSMTILIPEDSVIGMIVCVDPVIGDIGEEGIVLCPDFCGFFGQHRKLLVVASHRVQGFCRFRMCLMNVVIVFHSVNDDHIVIGLSVLIDFIQQPKPSDDRRGAVRIIRKLDFIFNEIINPVSSPEDRSHAGILDRDQRDLFPGAGECVKNRIDCIRIQKLFFIYTDPVNIRLGTGEDGVTGGKAAHSGIWSWV